VLVLMIIYRGRFLSHFKILLRDFLKASNNPCGFLVFFEPSLFVEKSIFVQITSAPPKPKFWAEKMKAALWKHTIFK